MNELELIKIAANVGGYLVMCFYLISKASKFVDKFLDKLIDAITANTAAQATLAEKIDALSKGPAK